MIWSLFTNRPQLAKYFWTLVPRKCVLNALVAGQICKDLPDSAPLTPEVSTTLEELQEYFTDSSKRILDFAHHSDSALTVKMMKAGSLESGYIPVWFLAYDLGAKEITASTAYQTINKDEWYECIDQSNSTLKLIITLLIPPLLLIWNPIADSTAEVGARGKHSSWRDMFLNFIPVRMNHKAMKENQDKPKWAAVGGGWYTTAKSRFTYFYAAPITTFFAEVMSYLSFAVTYSIAAIAPAYPVNEVFTLDDTLKITQLLTLLWVIAVIVDEIDQVSKEGLQKWFSSMWNRWDCIMYFIILWSMGMRFRQSDADMRVSKLLSGIGALLVWMRATRFFAYSKILGPKLYMVNAMVADILVFCALLILILIGYGVCALIIQMPWRSFDDHTIADIFFRPVFMVFGETFIDALQGESDCLDPNGGFKNCTQNSYFALVFLIMYLLICNILLVNLLIAMMSSTYERVAEESIQIWSLQNTELLEEFRIKFPVPAPFNLLYNLFRFLRLIKNSLKTLVSRKHMAVTEEVRRTWDDYTYGTFLEKHFLDFAKDETLRPENRFKELADVLKMQGRNIQRMHASFGQTILKTETLGGGGSSIKMTEGAAPVSENDNKKKPNRARRRTRNPATRRTSRVVQDDDPLAGILNDSD